MPLHTAVSTGAQLPDAPQMATILLQTFKESVQVRTDEGLLPIHLAAISRFNAGIRTILSTDYKSIAARESEFMLPVDFAIDSMKEEGSEDRDTIELLLSSALYGRVIRNPRNAGESYPFLPLHGAAISRPSIESWKELFYESQMSDIDVHGRSIAHLICTPRNDNEESDVTKEIEMLKLVPKECFKRHDNDGFLPLHRVLTNANVSVELMRSVITLENDAVLSEVKSSGGSSKFEEMLPIHVAAVHDCSHDVLFELLKRTTGSLSSLT